MLATALGEASMRKPSHEPVITSSNANSSRIAPRWRAGREHSCFQRVWLDATRGMPQFSRQSTRMQEVRGLMRWST